jgi:hypothetical protein
MGAIRSMRPLAIGSNPMINGAKQQDLIPISETKILSFTYLTLNSGFSGQKGAPAGSHPPELR